MRERSLVFCAAAASALFLMSCVSARPIAPTGELFDSRAAVDESPVVVAQLPLPAPIAPDTALLTSTKAAPSEAAPPPAAESPPALGTATAAMLPGDGSAAGTPELDSLTPVGKPRPASGFALAAPEAPPAATAASRGVVAPAPVSRATNAPTKQNPAPAPGAGNSAAGGSAASAGTPGAISPGSAASGSAAQGAGKAGTGGATAGSAGASSSSGATSPAEPYGRLREIYARVGDELQIGLESTGFLFLGFPDKQAQVNGMSFKSKETTGGKTVFTFQAVKLGTYDLDFLKQDNVAGTSTRETVRVHVVSDQDFTAAVEAAPLPEAAAPAETGDPAFADRLTGLRAYEAAVAELLKGYRDGNPALNDRIASLYLKMGSFDAAAKYYQKNLSPQGPLTPRAVIGLVRVAVAEKDRQLLIAQLKGLLAIDDASVEEPLMLAARMERDDGQIGIGIELAARYAALFPQGAWRDEADYITAQLLEADSPFRDIARARDLYRGILTLYPVSVFAGAARDRLQYIERHFYQVR